MSKQYGLILNDKQASKKAPPVFSASKNVFGNESDSEEEVGVPKAPLRTGEKLLRAARIVQNKALEEDPTVYQYDELYDDIEEKKKQAKTAVQKEEKKSRYIEKLLDTAEKRKRENERRVERQVQKEREEEGNKFADKESFVTSAYKQKLQEMREDEEKERREQYLEEIGDVTKQADLSGFYRNLYEQKLRPEKVRITTEEMLEKPVEIKEEKSDEVEKEDEKEEKIEKKNKAKRTYRKRKSSIDAALSKENENSDSDGEINRISLADSKKTRTHLQSNIDADSDFSIDSSSSDDEKSPGSKKSKKAKESNTEESEVAAVKEEKPDDDNFKKPDDVKRAEKIITEKPVDKKEAINEVEKVKPKIDIWMKRTVGVLFNEALQRYYERKSNRGH